MRVMQQKSLYPAFLCSNWRQFTTLLWKIH